MSKSKKQKLLKKTTMFNGQKLVLYSLDGEIWSSRTWELEKIAERHETERVTLHEEEKEDAPAEAATAPIGEVEEPEEEPVKPAKPPKAAPAASKKSVKAKPPKAAPKTSGKKTGSQKKGRLKAKAA